MIRSRTARWRDRPFPIQIVRSNLCARLAKTATVISPMANFILVCTDVDLPEGGSRTAEVVAKNRLAANRWPLYRRTPHQRRMAPDDRLLLYLGGSRAGAHSFYATARIDAIVPASRTHRPFLPALEGQQPATSWLVLKDIKRLEPRIPVSTILPKVSFLPKKNPRRWGVAFMSGVRVLTDADWDAISRTHEGDTTDTVRATDG